MWRRSDLIHFSGLGLSRALLPFFQVFDSFSICLVFFLWGRVFFWLFWEPGLSSGGWAAQLCGSSVFLGFLCPSRWFFGSKGCHWVIFFEPRGSLGSYFEGLGVLPGGFGAQSLLKIASPFRSPPFFVVLEAKWEPKGTQTEPKSENIGPKLDQKINTVLDRFFIGVWLNFDAKIDWLFNKNQDPQAYQNKMAESCKVQ